MTKEEQRKDQSFVIGLSSDNYDSALPFVQNGGDFGLFMRSLNSATNCGATVSALITRIALSSLATSWAKRASPFSGVASAELAGGTIWRRNFLLPSEC